MNQIDGNPFQKTPISIGGKIFGLLTEFSHLKWFDQIVIALTRPTITQSVSFVMTASGSSTDATIQFPENTVAVTDFPVLQSPIPPAGTCYTAHISNADQVVIRFNNYSGGALAVAAATFGITVLKQ